MNIHVRPPQSAAEELEALRRAQQEASDPKRSAWVSANAGAGKTTVLAGRVLRLLLEGTEPARILCLTYTKAAAAEMSNRIFGRLGRWALMDDETLRAEIATVQGTAPLDERVERARTLFARALETPGGLKIQTIHAFCEAVLHQFPLEANVPAHFTVVQDAEQADMLAEARGAMWVAAREGTDPALEAAAERVMLFGSDHAIDRALGEAIARREHIAPWLEEHGGPRGATLHLLARFGFEPDDTAERLAARFQGPMTHDDLRAVVERARTGSAKADAKFVEHLAPALEADDPALVLEACADVMLTKGGTVARTICSKKVAQDDADALAAQGEAVLEALERARLLELVYRSGDLFTLAADVMERYAQAKRRSGRLDFEDLIARTAELLERSAAAAWVHYKLDRGLHHVLVDEAQDTSPRQWRIIGKLVEEFFAGEGAVDPDDIGTGVARTVFVVGDEKQSIFSFQGAAPEEFAVQREHFGTLVAEADDLEGDFVVQLDRTFRSVQDVLTAVDQVFDHPERGRGLTSDRYVEHHSMRGGAPGAVDIWPLEVAGEGEPEPQEWTAPIDQIGDDHPAVRTANLIAEQVAAWTDGEGRSRRREVLESTGRPIEPGDVLVLVRARDQFVHALTRALKARKVPVAGADRLQLTEHIAVKDMVALGRVVLLPEDDLSLAEVLRSPLFDVDEDALFALAHGREGTLMDAVAGARPDIAREIAGWRALADRVPVHDFYARVLGPHGGRKRMFARLGREAEDVLDAFLQAALEHESGTEGASGLQGFVAAMTESEQEVKRDMDTARGEVRIMTVHGAKGLEAPVVFLVDKSSPARGGGGNPMLLGDEAGFVWVPSAGHHVPQTRRLLEAVEREWQAEYRRLLYVGMTRAADRLIVCGYRGKRAPGEPTWHDMVREALEPDCVPEDGVEGYEFLRYKLAPDPEWTPDRSQPEAEGAERRHAVPPWLRFGAAGRGAEGADGAAVPRPLTASGAQALIEGESLRGTAPPTLLPDDDETASDPVGEIARRRGTLVHRLLQTLPEMDPDARRDAATRFLQATLAFATPEGVAALVDEVMAVLEAPDTAPLLAGGRAEVAVMGRIDLGTGSRMITGQIDRLVASDDAVVVVDYKTNRVVPRSPDAVDDEYVAQLAIYRALVMRLYPDRPVRAVLVWTHAPGGPRVMDLPEAMLDDALEGLAAVAAEAGAQAGPGDGAGDGAGGGAGA